MRFMNYFQPGAFETISLFVSSVNCCHAMIHYVVIFLHFVFIVSILLSKIVNYQKNVKPIKLLFDKCFHKRENKTKRF